MISFKPWIFQPTLPWHTHYYAALIDRPWQRLTPRNYRGWQVIGPQPAFYLDQHILRRAGYKSDTGSSLTA